MNGVVLLDIKKAFDSVEWIILEKMLISNLSRKIKNLDLVYELISCYFSIIKNRNIFYKNKSINYSKGIPTGLATSNLIFTLFLEEIFFIKYKNFKKYKKEFLINIYVDDIYIKILNLKKSDEIVYGLINHLNDYKLNINLNKSKADKNLNLSKLNILQEKDFYLGIPFTRDLDYYMMLILKDLNDRLLFNKYFNKSISWNYIYFLIIKLSPNKFQLNIQKRILGFLSYKLGGLETTYQISCKNHLDIKRFLYKFITNKSNLLISY
jgi:hypothetical protein